MDFKIRVDYPTNKGRDRLWRSNVSKCTSVTDTQKLTDERTDKVISRRGRFAIERKLILFCPIYHYEPHISTYFRSCSIAILTPRVHIINNCGFKLLKCDKEEEAVVVV